MAQRKNKYFTYRERKQKFYMCIEFVYITHMQLINIYNHLLREKIYRARNYMCVYSVRRNRELVILNPSMEFFALFLKIFL